MEENESELSVVSGSAVGGVLGGGGGGCIAGGGGLGRSRNFSLHVGHTAFHAAHLSMHLRWKICPHLNLILVLLEDMQIEHLILCLVRFPIHFTSSPFFIFL